MDEIALAVIGASSFLGWISARKLLRIARKASENLKLRLIHDLNPKI